MFSDPVSSLDLPVSSLLRAPGCVFPPGASLSLFPSTVPEPDLSDCQNSFLGTSCPHLAAGRGTSPQPAPLLLTFGEVSLQIVRRRLEYMTPKDSTQLVPLYGTTAPNSPLEECYASSGDGGGTACTGSRCRQLKVRPAPMMFKERKWVVSPFSTYLGVLGGMFGLVLLALGHLHAAMQACMKSRGAFAPTVTAANRKAAAALLQAVQDERDGLTSLSQPERMQEPEARGDRSSAPLSTSTASRGPKKVRGGGVNPCAV